MSGYVGYSVEAPAAFVINRLASGGVFVKGIKITDAETSFSVSEFQRALTEKIFSNAGIKFRVTAVNGAKQTAKSFFKRFGLLLGIFFAACFFIIYSFSVTEIEISGNAFVPSETVLDAVTATGYTVPSFFVEPDCKSLSEAVCAIDGVSGATVKKVGTRLYVNILEKLPEIDIIDTQTPIPIKATVDGTIVSVFATSGTALVKTGDEVKAGDVLIAPYYLNAEGEEIPVRAMGEVKAEVTVTLSRTYSDFVIKPVRTGKFETLTSLVVFGLEYEKKPSFENCETETSVRDISAVIPLKTVTVTAYETRYETLPFDFDAEKDIIIENLYSELIVQLPTDVPITDKGFLVKRLDKMTELSIYYKVVQNIGG